MFAMSARQEQEQRTAWQSMAHRNEVLMQEVAHCKAGVLHAAR